MHKLLLFFLLTFSNLLFGQEIPTERIVNWSNAGHVGQFLETNNVVNFLDEGGIPDGMETDQNDFILQTIFDNNSDVPTTILFPTGNYFFKQQISVPNNFILKGNDLSTTKLLFDLENATDAILISGNNTTDSLVVANSVSKDSDYVLVSNSITFQIDDFVYLIDNDVEKVTSTWGLHSTGQICQIIKIIQDSIFFSQPIRRDFLSADQPVLIKMNMAENVGIENLTIERQDQTDNQTSNVSFEYSYNCWIKCVESINCNFAHFKAANSTNIEISDCYMHDAFDYGGGGKAYGVVLQYATGASLIYNNVFEHLRHSMLLQAGANGNVLSYNYSIDPFWTAVSLPSNSAGDAVLHGNYPYANLFEGNIIQQIVIDNSHGINGPHNTFFRNRAELFGIFMNQNPASNTQNFVGNEITNEGGLFGQYVLAGTNHFEYGNNRTGTIIPADTGAPTQSSLYLNQPPDFYNTNSNWPPIGNSTSFNQNNIEAKDRYENGQVTPCSPIVSGLVPTEFQDQIKLFPNPVSETLFIDTGDLPFENVFVRNVLGKTILETTNTNFDISFLDDGIYFVELRRKNKPVVIASFVKISQQ